MKNAVSFTTTSVSVGCTESVVRSEGRKAMFYLTTHSTHFIYGYLVLDIWRRTFQIAREETRCRHMGYFSRLASRVLLYAFNDKLNTLFLRLYCVRHMVKDHSDSEKGNPLPPHGLLFRLTARVLLYTPSHRQDSTHHGLYYTNCVALAGTKHRSMGPS